MEWKLDFESVHGLNKLVTDLIDKEYDDNDQETSETKTEVFALKTNVLAFASPKQDHEDVLLPANLQELYLSGKDIGLILSQKSIRLSRTQCQNS